MNQLRALLITIALIAPLLPRAVLAQTSEEQCFVQTKQCVSGRFLEYWRQNGGLAVFGYPISPASPERNPDTDQTYLTQWFERNRFELHPENTAPYDVLLGLLGGGLLRQQGIDWQTLPRESGPRPGCLWFAATGHNVCDQEAETGFQAVWLSHGLNDPRLDDYQQSLALFGYPLTAMQPETNSSGDTVLTQWFERARFEWHPDKPSPYRVLLGLLGNEAAATPTRPLKYFWPTVMPRDLAVRPEQSFAGETAFVLTLAEPAGGQLRATIAGGPGSIAVNRPPEQGGQPTMVRGQPGLAVATGAGHAVYWTEDRQPYAIVGGLGLADALALAEGLEALDLGAWRSRLAAAS